MAHLFSDDINTRRVTYGLLQKLVINFEKHSKISKNINIDNFEDDDIFNSNSGGGLGFLEQKKNKKSTDDKKYMVELIQSIKESSLFEYIKFILNQITKDHIKDKLKEI